MHTSHLISLFPACEAGRKSFAFSAVIGDGAERWERGFEGRVRPRFQTLFQTLSALRFLHEVWVPGVTQLCLFPAVWRRGAAAPVRAPHHAASAQPVRDAGHGRRAAGTEL